jgi:hypothetical protein
VLREANKISETDRQEEYALFLRERAEAASHRRLFTEAETAVAQLEGMASHTPSAAIQHALSGASGAVLLYEGNYDQALPLLEQDNENAFSLFRLAFANQKLGSEQSAQARLVTARSFSHPTAEQAFVDLSKTLERTRGAFLTAVHS